MHPESDRLHRILVRIAVVVVFVTTVSGIGMSVRVAMAIVLSDAEEDKEQTGNETDRPADLYALVDGDRGIRPG